ncbi:MAG: bifunctional DNA primase/polymerase [Chloroflexota bacterium]
MLIDHALKYVAAGFSVIPVYYGTKFPAQKILGGSWSIYQEKRAAAVEVKGWFDQAKGGELNLAAVCGPISGNLLILDFDHKAESNFARWKELVGPIASYLPTAETGKGFHVYMKVKGEGRTLILARDRDDNVLIETRGRNNLCMLPGSRHPNGYDYRWVLKDETKIPTLTERQLFQVVGAASMLNQLPDEVCIQEPKKVVTVSGGKMQSYTKAALTAVIDQLKQTRGNRNHALNGAAYRLGRFVGDGLLEQSIAEDALRAACEANGYIEKDGERAFLATMRSGLTAGISNPLGKT